MSQQLPNYFRLIDLSGVPIPDFVETLDVESIVSTIQADYIARYPAFTAALESEPVIKLIEACAYRELILRQRINDVARANTITEALGADLQVLGAFFNTAKMEGETETAYRRRVQMGIAISSAAGPRRAYEYHALSTATNVIDAGIHSPAAGEVVVTILAYEDVASGTATDEQKAIGAALFLQPSNTSLSRVLVGNSSETLTKVRAKLSDDDVRPLTDALTVRAPSLLEYSIVAELTIYPGPDAAAVRNSALASLSKYLLSVRKVSYDSTRAGIIAALSVPGVQNVNLISPSADVVASYYDLCVCTSVNVTVIRVDI